MATIENVNLEEASVRCAADLLETRDALTERLNEIKKRLIQITPA